MYRKEADRLIVRDVRRRLAEMRLKQPWADWQTAVTASQAENIHWYRHHMPALYESLEPLLREAGIDMAETNKPFRFVGNIAPGSEA
jgi:hypothetical protein